LTEAFLKIAKSEKKEKVQRGGDKDLGKQIICEENKTLKTKTKGFSKKRKSPKEW